MTTIKSGARYLCCLVIFGLLVGCSGVTRKSFPASTQSLVENQPQPTTSQVVIENPSEPKRNFPAACQPAQQAMALRPGYELDWDRLAGNTCYELTLDIDPAVSIYQGTAATTLTNHTGSTLRELLFRTYPNAAVIYGGSLDITEVKIDDQQIQAEVILEDHTGLRFDLPTPLTPGDTLTINMKFEGKLPLSFDEENSTYGIFKTTTRPMVITLANWYPILANWQSGSWQAAPVAPLGDAVVSDTAFYSVQINAPADWSIITSGSEVAPNSYVSGPARDFMIVAGPAFILTETEENGVRIRHFGLPGGEKRWQEAIQATMDSLKIFDDRFGAYPYAELDIAAVPLFVASGVEYPGMFLLSDTLYTDQIDQAFLLGLVAAHETAHQWWYSVVGNDVLQHPWLDEALATFSSFLFQEQYQSDDYLGTLRYFESNIKQAEEVVPNLTPSLPVNAFLADPGMYSIQVYQRGGMFFHTLREHIGEQAFFSALQTYYSSQRFSTAFPGTLLDTFESACACELDAFYQDWGITPPVESQP